jgi:hypothetical protein
MNNVGTPLGDYVELIISILETRYAEEYELLAYLAADDRVTFNEFARNSSTWVSHLEGYGVVAKSHGEYHFRINVVRENVLSKKRRLSMPGTIEQRWASISERRNAIETRLREIVRMLLKTTYGTAEAKRKIVDVMANAPQKLHAQQAQFDHIFKRDLFFSDLKRIIEKEWPLFERVFKSDRSRFATFMETVNTFRNDAHARPIGDDDYALLAAHMMWLEKCVEENC